jgi:hypothetical protein
LGEVFGENIGENDLGQWSFDATVSEVFADDIIWDYIGGEVPEKMSLVRIPFVGMGEDSIEEEANNEDIIGEDSIAGEVFGKHISVED